MNAATAFRPRKDLPQVKLRLAALAAVILLSACRHAGDITADNGGGVYAVRSACPIAGVPAGTGDITLFDPPSSTDSRAIDVTAAITDVRATCQDAGNDVVSTATFTIVGLAPRCRAGAAGGAALFRRGAAGRPDDRREAGSARRCSTSRPATSTPGRGCRRRSASIGGAATLPDERPPDPHPPAQGRRGRCGGRSAGRSGVRDRRRQCDLRASGRLPADPGSAQV